MLSEEELSVYRSMPYERYLRTPHWFATRNRALKRAGYKCTRCDAGRDLQVHHLSYERIGAELDTDLEVRCRGCHLGEHVMQLHEQLAVYTRVISDALLSDEFATVADLAEEVKRRCARARIPYSDGQIQAALARMGKRLDTDLRVATPKKYAELLDEGRDNQPFTKAEACGILAKLGAIPKPMPTVERITERQADARIVAKQLAALILDQVQRCEEVEEAIEAKR